MLSTIEIKEIQETRIESDLIEMTEEQLAKATVDVLKARYSISPKEAAALSEELADWAQDELLSLWDGCAVSFITLCPTSTDRWLERCTVSIDNVVLAVTSETAAIIQRGMLYRYAKKWLAKHPHSVQDKLDALKQRMEELKAQNTLVKKVFWGMFHQLNGQIIALTEIESCRKSYTRIIENGLD